MNMTQNLSVANGDPPIFTCFFLLLYHVVECVFSDTNELLKIINGVSVEKLSMVHQHYQSTVIDFLSKIVNTACR